MSAGETVRAVKSSELFGLDPHIRYVAVNQGGHITTMEQSPTWPSYNPDDTDRMEELIVNPAVIELTRRRGNLDLDGLRFVAIRYGLQWQLVFPYANGHLSVGVEPAADVSAVAEKVAGHLGLPV